MKSIRSKIAAVAIAVAAIIAAPAAASAAGYTPAFVDGPTTIAPGGSGVFTFDDFSAGQSVVFTLSGEGVGPGNLASVKTAVTNTSVTKTANSSGVASVEVILPANATGTYTLSVGGYSDLTRTITASTSGSAIADTGFDAGSMLGVWIGGGVLLLGGVLVTVFAARRERQDA